MENLIFCVAKRRLLYRLHIVKKLSNSSTITKEAVEYQRAKWTSLKTWEKVRNDKKESFFILSESHALGTNFLNHLCGS